MGDLLDYGAEDRGDVEREWEAEAVATGRDRVDGLALNPSDGGSTPGRCL